MIKRGTPILIHFGTIAQVATFLLILASLFTPPDFKVNPCRHMAASAAVSDVCKPTHGGLVVYEKF
jgi:hypothetical protein